MTAARPRHPVATCPWCERTVAYYPTTRTLRHHGRGCPGSGLPLEATDGSETVGDVLDALETLDRIAYGPPADPAGLDAAIEASGGLGGLLSHAEAAQILRAAAPHVRRAVLLAEADALLAEIRLQSSWFWYELGESAIEKLAKRLRERAERETTT